MTHDELLAKINNFTCCSGAHELALRAVLELHKPIKAEDLKNNSKISGICLACTPLSLNFYEAIRYPCPTIQAIEEQLK